MQELVQIAFFMQQYVTAVQSGIMRASMEFRDLVEQHIETQAKSKLHSTKENYINAINVSMESYVLIVEMDKDNWLACATEEGVKGFDMNNPPNGKGALSGPNAKMGKNGYKYVRIPIGKEAGAKPGPMVGDRGKRIQEKINAVMKRPQIVPGRMGNISQLHTKMGNKYLPGVLPGGQIVESQKLATDDPEISGLYRSRIFANSQEFHAKQESKRGMPKWLLTMFRTMSDNPLSKHWLHPGIVGVRIFPDTEQWANMALGPILEKNINEALQKMGLGR